MRTIDNKTTSYPYGQDKDSLPLNESTIGDLRQPLFALLYKAGMQPNEQPEKFTNSQIMQALDLLYNHQMGAIIKIYGETTNKKLLKLDGRTLDITDPKYANLVKYLYNNPNLLINKFGIGAADAFYKFKIDINNNTLTIPDYTNKNITTTYTDTIKANQPITTGSQTKHKHTINNIAINLTDTQVHLQKNLNHTHKYNKYFLGSLDSIIRYFGETHPSGAMYIANTAFTTYHDQIHNHTITTYTHHDSTYGGSQSGDFGRGTTSTQTVALTTKYKKAQFLHIDTRRAGAKSGGILPTSINVNSINATLSMPAQSIQLDKNNDNQNNMPAGVQVNYYMKI